MNNSSTKSSRNLLLKQNKVKPNRTLQFSRFETRETRCKRLITFDYRRTNRLALIPSQYLRWCQILSGLLLIPDLSAMFESCNDIKWTKNDRINKEKRRKERYVHEFFSDVYNLMNEMRMQEAKRGETLPIWHHSTRKINPASKTELPSVFDRCSTVNHRSVAPSN